MQFLTYSGSVNAGVIINFSSYNAVLISSSSIKKRGLVKEAYIYILYDLKEDREEYILQWRYYIKYIYFFYSYVTIELLLIKPWPHTLFWTILLNKPPAVAYFKIFNKINPKP